LNQSPTIGTSIDFSVGNQLSFSLLFLLTRGGVHLILSKKFLETVELTFFVMMLLLHLLVFLSEIRVLIRRGRFGRQVEVDTVNSFLYEFLLDVTDERSEFR
jgi:hypothetical protein